jgi:hypothetical protein
MQARQVGGSGLERYKRKVGREIQKGRRDSREERPLILTSIRQIMSNIKIRQENLCIFKCQV